MTADFQGHDNAIAKRSIGAHSSDLNVESPQLEIQIAMSSQCVRRRMRPLGANEHRNHNSLNDNVENRDLCDHASLIIERSKRYGDVRVIGNIHARRVVIRVAGRDRFRGVTWYVRVSVSIGIVVMVMAVVMVMTVMWVVVSM